MKWSGGLLLLLFIGKSMVLTAQVSTNYRVEMLLGGSVGADMPLWLTANRYGILQTEPQAGLLRGGLFYQQTWGRHWGIGAGLDLFGSVQGGGRFRVQQLYAEVHWRCLNLSVGAKERSPFLERPFALSSGTLVEDGNARPLPQVRGEIAEYVAVPGTKRWLAFKGYVAYGRFTDDRWQRTFAAPVTSYVQGVLYH